MGPDVSRADATRTITNEDDPHISAHGGYQSPKTTTNSGLVMRSIWSTNSLVEIQSQQPGLLRQGFPLFLSSPARACGVGLFNPGNDSRQQGATSLSHSLRYSSGSRLRILGDKFWVVAGGSSGSRPRLARCLSTDTVTSPNVDGRAKAAVCVLGRLPDPSSPAKSTTQGALARIVMTTLNSGTST